MRLGVLAVILAIGAAPLAAQDLVTKSSPAPVGETMDALVAAVEGAGATIFARVDHGAGAASVEMEMGEAQLLIFGNPRLGMPVMQEDVRAGLVLPLRVLVYEDADGATQVTYEAVDAMLGDFDISADLEVLGRMRGALDNLTGAAVGG